MPKEKNIFAIDAMRAVSILAVILIHTTTRVLESVHYDLNNYQWTLFLNQLSRFAVPLFILISGFVLELSHNINGDWITFYKKRLSKIFIPYLFWSALYYLLVYTDNSDNFIQVLLKGNASYQLYFIPSLCLFYLLFPILHKAYKLISNIFIFLGLSYLELSLMYRDYFIQQFRVADPIRIFVLNYIFFVLGMVMARNKDVLFKFVSKYKYYLLTLFLIFTVYIFKEGKTQYFLTYNIKAFYSQWRISVLIYTLSIFGFIYYLFSQEKFQLKLFSALSKLSYFVFFVHVLVLEVIWKLFGFKLFLLTTNNPIAKLFFDPVFFVIVTLISFAIAYSVHKVRYLVRITG